jgi:hypothetical protein
MDVHRHELGTGELYETLVSIPAYAEQQYMLDGAAVAAADEPKNLVRFTRHLRSEPPKLL